MYPILHGGNSTVGPGSGLDKSTQSYGSRHTLRKGPRDYGRVVKCLDESNNVWHCTQNARFDVLEQEHVPFLKGHTATHAVVCMPPMQSSSICAILQLKFPGTKSAMDPFFWCCGLGARGVEGIRIGAFRLFRGSLRDDLIS